MSIQGIERHRVSDQKLNDEKWAGIKASEIIYHRRNIDMPRREAPAQRRRGKVGRLSEYFFNTLIFFDIFESAAYNSSVIVHRGWIAPGSGASP
jgi:hypothetical protein